VHKSIPTWIHGISLMFNSCKATNARKGLVNNSTLTRIHGCIPAVSVDEGKRECQVGVSRSL